MLDSDRQLAEFLPELSGADWIALDTEADSLHAYPEKVCLIQISILGRDRLIDPLSGLDLTALLKILKKRELILHGADYDLRLLYRTFHFIPHAIFDTMLAARLVGRSEFGLTDLVSGYLGVNLEKGPQKMNWAKRPLTARMEAYARNDTRYLKPLADLLRVELERKNRLGWLKETCERLIADCSKPRSAEPDRVWRIKGSDRLNPRGLAILRALWEWRQSEALRAGKPPYFILSHETLVEVAHQLSIGQAIGATLPVHIPSKRRERLGGAAEQALGIPSSEFPQPWKSVSQRLSKTEHARFEALKRQRDRHAAVLGIDPTLIASRPTLTALARDWDGHQKELMRWQRGFLV